MDEVVYEDVPTPAFVEKFERATKLYAEYCQLDTSTTRHELARKAVAEVQLLELEPIQQMLVMKVMGYHGADNSFDKMRIIGAAWHYYTST